MAKKIKKKFYRWKATLSKLSWVVILQNSTLNDEAQSRLATESTGPAFGREGKPTQH